MSLENTAEDVNSNVQKKREGYINWNDYFMATAVLAAKRSKDPRMQVGACIINEDNKIVGIGYNGMPIGCSDDEFPWGKDSSTRLNDKHLYVCHAELNAIVNKYAADIRGCTIYVSLFPCNECAKIIIQSGIKTVIYLSDKKAGNDETVASKKMFLAAGVACRRFKSDQKKIEINLVHLEATSETQGALENDAE